MTTFFKKYWWGLSFTLLLWLGGSYYAMQGNNAAFESIYRTPVAGKIRSLRPTNHGFAVEMTLTDLRRYRVFPVDRGERGFMAVAAVGDSLRKQSFSDTLILIQKGRIGRYAFEKMLY